MVVIEIGNTNTLYIWDKDTNTYYKCRRATVKEEDEFIDGVSNSTIVKEYDRRYT